MAREVTVNAQGLATGVSYINTATGRDAHSAREWWCWRRARVNHRGSCSTPSRRSSRRDSPTRAALCGKYLTDTTGGGVDGFIPKLMDHVPHNCDGVGGGTHLHALVADNKKLDFPRATTSRCGAARCPVVRLHGRHPAIRPGGGYGAQLKNDYRRYYGSTIGFRGSRRADT
jgi:hypothetical protein